MVKTRPSLAASGFLVVLALCLGWATPGVRAQTSCPPSPCTAGRDVGRGFFVGVVERLNGVSMNDFAVDALMAWSPHENTSACWNPLATTQPMEVICNFNSVGVQHYQDEHMGVRATARTLNLGYYDALRAMLDLQAFDREAVRAALGTWGTCHAATCDSLLNQWQGLWADHALQMAVIKQPQWTVIVAGETLPVALEIRNAGTETWRVGEVVLANQRNPWGADPRQALTRDVRHGDTAAFAWTATGFSSWGVRRSEWRMAKEEDTFGTTVTISVVVLPRELADKKAELEAKLREWAERTGEELEEAVRAWIEEQLERLVKEAPREIWDEVCGARAALLAVGALVVAYRRRK